MTTTTAPNPNELIVRLRRPHPKQEHALNDGKKRSIWRAGRRGGKTTGACNKAVEGLLARKRVLYAAPTGDQLSRFWVEAKSALGNLIDADVVRVNETTHIIEFPGTEARIRAKTAWNADTLRGDYADLLILDEYQLMSEDAWAIVGAPMLLDNNGDVVFIYTPPSLHSMSVSKARDKRHASKFWKSHQDDPRWGLHHWTSHDNPHISAEALADISGDMTRLAILQEIMAEDADEVPGALWTQAVINASRVTEHPPLIRVVVGVDPPGGATEAGIVAVGVGGNGHLYVLRDDSLRDSPDVWASAVINCYNQVEADRVVGETNYGGDMVHSVIRTAAYAKGQQVSYKNVHATRGKAVRAEPIAAGYERGQVHHVGEFPLLEEEMSGWLPGATGQSPNRMDALVWACTELGLLPPPKKAEVYNVLSDGPRQPNPLGLDLNDDKYRDRDARS